MSRRKGEITQMPLWMPVFMIAAALALGVVLVTLLRHDEISTDTAADRAFRSALLPDGWDTYSADVWSVGYPGDWEVTSTSHLCVECTEPSIVIGPDDEQEATFFSIRNAGGEGTLEELLEAYTDTGEVKEQSEFLFAGYPAIKLVLSGGAVLHLVTYGNDDIYAISTEHYDDPEVGIMLATFQFNVKE